MWWVTLFALWLQVEVYVSGGGLGVCSGPPPALSPLSPSPPPTRPCRQVLPPLLVLLQCFSSHSLVVALALKLAGGLMESHVSYLTVRAMCHAHLTVSSMCHASW